MPWLKKHQPVLLYQSSDIPYVILEDGVHLCYDNCYGTQINKEEHNIQFKTSAINLKRINTYFYKFVEFPIIVPFEDVISLDNAIVEGQAIKNASLSSEESKSAILINSGFIKEVSDSTEFNEILELFDHKFILVGDSIDPRIRLFSDISTIIAHSQWTRTMTIVAHKICNNSVRKYCWTKTIPEVSLECYGIQNQTEFENIHMALEHIGISNINVSWSQLEDPV